MLSSLRIFLSLALSASLGAQSQPPTSPDDLPELAPPNILLIMVDDMGVWDTSYSGNPYIETPSLKRLEQESVNFTRFHAAPVCAPTRAGVLTGRYYLRTGLYNTRFGGDSLGKEEITIAELLQKEGYRTGLFGKWHLGRYFGYQPNQRGFDEFFGHYHGHIERYENPDQVYYNGQQVESRGYVSELFADASMDFMGTSVDAEKPFFCFLSFNAPHSPFVLDTSHYHQATGDELIVKYLEKGLPIREARIYAMVERVDMNIGRVMEWLAESDLERDTVVFFMSDNGGVSKFWKNDINGNKASVYRGGTLSPLLMRWPNEFASDSHVDALTSHTDLFPTICELAGVALPEDRAIDGKSLLPLAYGDRSVTLHEHLYQTWDRFYPNPDQRWSITGEQYKLMGQFGQTADPDPTKWRLFDLKADPGETVNLLQKKPEIAETLRTEFVRWFEEATDGVTYEPIAIPVGHRQENPVEIQPSWAFWDGRAVEYVFEGYDWDTIEGWVEPGEKAIWNLDIAAPGIYDVTVEYGCAWTDSGGEAQLTIGDQVMSFSPRRTPSANVFLRHRLEPVKLEKGPTEMTVECISAPGNELMRLNRIWLRRR